MNKEIRGLHEAAYLLALFTFAGQLLSLVRDRTFAHLFGAGPELDAYFAAFRIPDLTFAFFTLFVSTFALIPLFEKRGGVLSRETGTLLGSVFLAFGTVAIAASTILFFLLPSVTGLLFGGFSDAQQQSVIDLSRIMLLQPIFLGLSLIVGSVVQATRKFLIYALAPVIYNLGVIVGALIFYPWWGISGLGWGVVLGASLHFLIQVVPLILTKDFSVPRVSPTWFRDVREVVLLSIPRSLAVGVHQVVLLSFAVIGAWSVVGSASVLMFGFNLQSVPLAIVGVSYASALFPSLSTLYARGERTLFVKEVWTAVRHISLWIMFAIALMIVLRAHVVRVLLGTGAFTWNDTRLTAAVLAGFVISLVAQSVMLIFSRAYYAAGRQKIPIIMNVVSALLASLASFVVFWWFQGATVFRFFAEELFRVGGIPGTEVVMVALTFSLVMMLSAIMFALLFGRDFGFEKKTAISILHSFSAAVIGGGAAYSMLQLFGPLLPTDTFFGIFTQGAIAALSGTVAWIATLFLVKSQEFDEVVVILKRLVSA